MRYIFLWPLKLYREIVKYRVHLNLKYISCLKSVCYHTFSLTNTQLKMFDIVFIGVFIATRFLITGMQLTSKFIQTMLTIYWLTVLISVNILR